MILLTKAAYQAVHVTLSHQQALSEIPTLLDSLNNIPAPSCGVGTNYSRDSTQRRMPVYVVNGRIPQSEIDALKSACGGRRNGVHWIEISANDVAAAGGASAEIIANLIKSKLG